MAQGFKPLKRNVPEVPKKKSKSTASAPKVGKRIPPKKHHALQEVAQKKVRRIAYAARHGTFDNTTFV